MALAVEQKSQMIAKYRIHKSDSGSPEVQVALLSQRILQLTEHFKAHKKDHHSRRGLLTMVSRRRKMLKYLKDRSPERYQGADPEPWHSPLRTVLRQAQVVSLRDIVPVNGSFLTGSQNIGGLAHALSPHLIPWIWMAAAKLRFVHTSRKTNVSYS